MKVGKVPTEVLEKSVFSQLKATRKEVLVRPKIGEDCSILDFGDTVCVVSTDPITGASHQIGHLAVHVNCNDIASCGAEPIGLLLTILAPPETQEAEIYNLMNEISVAAAELGVEILGGHTEISTTVERLVISVTAIGKAPKDRFVTTSGAQVGNDLLITKTVGLEGTAILATDFKELLEGHIEGRLIEEGQKLLQQISVIPEGLSAAQYGVTAMHDVTEGGLIGAAFEVAAASEVGLEIWEERVPIAPSTKAICNFFDANPLGLVSSGCMLITAPNGAQLERLLKDKGIQATVIGKVTPKDCILVSNGERQKLYPLERDELYRILDEKIEKN